MSRRQRPLHRVAVGAEGRHVPGVGLLDQVAGEQHVGVGDAHDQVAARVAAAGVDQLDEAVAEVERDRRRERALGTTTSVAATSAQRGSSSSAAEARTSAACSGRVSAAVSWQIELRALRLEHAVAERVVEVLVAVDGAQHRQALTRRRSATTSRASAADAWVSRTSSPAPPATTETLTSSQG